MTQLTTLVTGTERMANKVHQMGNEFEQEVQKINAGQKKQFDALDQMLKWLESGTVASSRSALAVSQQNGQSNLHCVIS